MPIQQLLQGQIAQAIRLIFEAGWARPITLVVQPNHASDPVALGNSLGKVLNAGLGLQLFGEGMPWPYHLALLEASSNRLEPFTLCILAADDAVDLLRHLDALETVPVVAHLSGEIPPELHHLPVHQLGQVGKTSPPPSRSKRVQQSRLEHTLARKNWPVALELLAHHLPDQLLEHLETIAQALFDAGQGATLEQSLSTLQAPLSDYPRVLRWRMAVAIDTWTFESLLPLVEKALAADSDLELRAYYALSLHHLGQHEEALEQIDLALVQERSPLLLLAEHTGQPLLQARCGVLLAQTAMQFGQPQQTQHWADWSLTLLERSQRNFTPYGCMPYCSLPQFGSTRATPWDSRGNSAARANASRRPTPDYGTSTRPP